MEGPAWDLFSESLVKHLFFPLQLSICNMDTIMPNCFSSEGCKKAKQRSQGTKVVQGAIGGLSIFVAVGNIFLNNC